MSKNTTNSYEVCNICFGQFFVFVFFGSLEKISKPENNKQKPTIYNRHGKECLSGLFIDYNTGYFYFLDKKDKSRYNKGNSTEKNKMLYKIPLYSINSFEIEIP